MQMYLPKSLRSCFGAIVLMAVSAILFSGLASILPHRVTLEAHPTVGAVRIFEDLQSDRVTSLPIGTRCKQIDENSYKIGSGETAMYFLKLDCDGTVGYVNRQWVKK